MMGRTERNNRKCICPNLKWKRICEQLSCLCVRHRL